MRNKLLKIFFILVLVKSLIWMFLVPVFQIPDEPSHFGIVEFLAENKRRPHPRREVVTPAEVMRAAEAVNFNWQINHPVWQGYAADWRDRLKNLDPSLRKQTTANDYQTSLKRPPLYYYLAAPFYFLGGSSFLGRFFAVRLLSVILHLLTVWLGYQAAKRIFKSSRLGLTTAGLVAFQPMLSFLSVGVHYDPLAIFLVTAFIYSVVFSRRVFSWTAALLGVLVKPDLIFLPFLKLRVKWLFGSAVTLLLVLAALTRPLVAFIASQQTGALDKWLYLTNLNEYSAAASFWLTSLSNGQLWLQLKNYFAATAAIHWAQIFPWYWGTFGWLEVPLPAWVFAFLKLVMLVSLLGWVKWWFSQRTGNWGWFWALVLIQALIVSANDFKVFTETGKIFGIQGRYFLPAILAQMILLVFGLRQWFDEKFLTKALLILSLGLNLVGLMTVYQYFGNVWR